MCKKIHLICSILHPVLMIFWVSYIHKNLKNQLCYHMGNFEYKNAPSVGKHYQTMLVGCIYRPKFTSYDNTLPPLYNMIKKTSCVK
jgi:hypothetical protein